MITRKRNSPKPKIVINGREVTFKKSIKYLGVWIDDKLRFDD